MASAGYGNTTVCGGLVTAPPTIQTNPLDPVFSGVPVVVPQGDLVSPTWNKWFVDLREKVNVINATLAAWSGITPVTGLTPGTYGDATHYPIVTVNEFGLVTNVTVQSVSGGGGSPMHITTVTSDYTVALPDVPNASANVGMVVSNSSISSIISLDVFANTNIPVGTSLYVFQQGAGSVSVTGLPGVSFYGPTISGGGQGSQGQFIQIATNSWAVSGNIAYSAAGPSDPYWSDVVALLYFNGVNGGTSFPDETSMTWTVHGTIQTSTAAAKFGSSSMYPGTSTGYLTGASSANFGFGSGDFTIDGWVQGTATVAYKCLFDTGYSSGSGLAIFVASSSDTKIHIFMSGSLVLSSTSSITTTGFDYFEVNRSAGTLRVFKNGILEASVANSTVLNSSAAPYIGNNYALNNQFQIYLNEFRVTKGVARNTANYTPPTARAPNY